MDATGVAWWTSNDDTIYYLKGPDDAHKFTTKGGFSHLDNTARQAIVHTRAATQGSPDNNDNNHPIVLPGMVGIHNGIIWNDGEVIRNLALERVAEVDSAVIFQLIQRGGLDKVTTNLVGDAAIAWMEFDAIPTPVPTLRLAALGGRPLVIAQTPEGDFIFASTEQAVRESVEIVGGTVDFVMSVPDGTYIEVHEGRITTFRDCGRIDNRRTTRYADLWRSPIRSIQSIADADEFDTYEPGDNPHPAIDRVMRSNMRRHEKLARLDDIRSTIIDELIDQPNMSDRRATTLVQAGNRIDNLYRNLDYRAKVGHGVEGI